MVVDVTYNNGNNSKSFSLSIEKNLAATQVIKIISLKP